MIAPPQCPVDNRLMLQYAHASSIFDYMLKDRIKKERDVHRLTCPVCRARMAYFKAMMEK